MYNYDVSAEAAVTNKEGTLLNHNTIWNLQLYQDYYTVITTMSEYSAAETQEGGLFSSIKGLESKSG
jgi:hypothetical protein